MDIYMFKLSFISNFSVKIICSEVTRNFSKVVICENERGSCM